MPKRNLAWMLMILMVALLYWRLGDMWARPGAEYDTFAPLAEARAAIHRLYVEPVSDRLLVEGAMHGMFRALQEKYNDPHSIYFPQEDYREFNKQHVGEFSGIGINLGMNEQGQLMIISPIAGGPAQRAGIRAGDVIMAIDGTSAIGLNLHQAVEKLTGAKGSSVTVRVRHREASGGPLEEDIEIVRDVIHISTLTGWQQRPDGEWRYLIHHDPAIAFVKIIYFSQGTVSDLDKTVRRLLSAGMQGLVLDLRSNPGGPLDAAVQTVDRFIDQGDIVWLEGRRPHPDRAQRQPGKTPAPRRRRGLRRAQREDTYHPEFPLVVLIDENTASAAEIVAGALQAHKRAIIVGTRSFGKGSVQDVLPLGAGNGAIKLTTAYYRLPGGRVIQRRPGAEEWGVDPDEVVRLAPRGPTSRPGGRPGPSTRAGLESRPVRVLPTTRPGGAGRIDLHDPSTIPDLQVRRGVEILLERLAPVPAERIAGRGRPASRQASSGRRTPAKGR